MAKTATEAIRAAFQRARGRRPLVHFLTQNAGGFACYVVGSAESTDSAYRVTVKAGEYWCCCPAGDVGRPCWHAAAVYAVRASRQAFGMPADGPTAEQAAAAAAHARRVAAGERLAAIADLFAA